MRSLIWFKIQSCRKLTQTSMESCGEVTLNSMLTKEGSMELRQNIMLSCGIPWKSGYVFNYSNKVSNHFLKITFPVSNMSVNGDPLERRICSPLWLVPRAASKRAKPAAQKRSVTVRGASLSASSIEKHPYTSDRHATYMYFTYIYMYIHVYIYMHITSYVYMNIHPEIYVSVDHELGILFGFSPPTVATRPNHTFWFTKCAMNLIAAVVTILSFLSQKSCGSFRICKST